VADIQGVQTGNTITLTTTTTGASIYYTADESDPTADKTLYSGSISLSYPQTVTIKAIAIKADYYDSGIFTKSFDSFPIVDVPQANRTINTITFTANPTDAEIHYTLDGTPPTAGSTKYTSGIVITQTTNIKAIATKTDWETSGLFNQTYEFVAKPNVVRTGDKVAISTVTSGASLYYTIDGGELTAYTAPVTVKTNTAITAIAKKNGVDSEGFEGSFTATYNQLYLHLSITPRFAFLKDLEYFENPEELTISELMGYMDPACTQDEPYVYNPENKLQYSLFYVEK
jgi:hypothetical protein